MPYEAQVELLNKVKAYTGRSLENGMALREQIHKSIEAGEDVDNYRTRWLKDSVMRVFKLLEDMAMDFNTQHQLDGDRVSSLDLGDIMESTLSTMQSRLKG